MEVILKVEKTFDAMYLQAEVNARYWEDATVCGESDDLGMIPCRKGDLWCPVIEIDTGIITNWEQGKTAEVHYKVCDEGNYKLLDSNLAVITEIDGYVPKLMCPEGDGYGDYIIMKIDENGKIANWDPTFDEFNSDN